MAEIDGRGRDAEGPTDIPASGWRDIGWRTLKEAKADNVPLLAAGVAFYGLLALAPALAALAGLYGLVADPADAARQVRDLLGAAPVEVRNLVQVQLTAAAQRSHGSALILVVAGAAVAVWSASSGMQHLVSAINAAYDQPERRGFVRLRALALLLTAGAVLFVVASVGTIALLPSALASTGLGDAARITIGVLRWPALALGMVSGLSVLYRVAPDRDEPRWRWAGTGSVVATALWLVGSAAFSVYASSFGRYQATYGALGAIVVVMLWLFLTAYAVLLGAELNAQMERQTLNDTTTGSSRPLGRRGAEAADTVGPSVEEIKAGDPPSADVAADPRGAPKQEEPIR